MSRLMLIKPSKDYSDQVWKYRTEFLKQGDSLDGCASLDHVHHIDEWLMNLEKNSYEETVTAGLVPATTYLAICKADKHLIGMIDIRHRLNDYLLNYAGHIGYSVRMSERRKGFAIEMVHLALVECRDTLALSRVLITCNKKNIASAKTILANGGVLENEVVEGEETTQRYWINLN